MVEAALMVALGVVLSRVQFTLWAQGGTITLASMAPVVLLSLRHGYKWGLLAGFTHSLLQMLLDGIAAPPVQNFAWYAVVVALDFVIAFTVLGLAGLFAKPFEGKRWYAAVGAVSVTALRYLCHIISGIAVWGIYATEGMPVWLYSVTYNGTYMIPEMVITAVAATLLYPVLRDRVTSK